MTKNEIPGTDNSGDSILNSGDSILNSNFSGIIPGTVYSIRISHRIAIGEPHQVISAKWRQPGAHE